MQSNQHKERNSLQIHLMKQTDLGPSKTSLQTTQSKPQLRKYVKNVKKKSYPTRRSGRIRNTAKFSKSLSSEPYVEEIVSSASEDEKEEEELPVEVEKNMTTPTTKGLEQKIDDLANQNPLCTSNSYASGLKYQTMYLDSQKKIEELKEVNRQLTQKLDNALCKVEVYEKCTRDSSEMFEKLKDLVLILSLGKVPQTVIDVQCEAVDNAKICGSKRKKQTKGRVKR